MKKFNSFRNRQNGFEDLGSGNAEAAKAKKSWWKIPGIILVILVIAIFTFNFRRIYTFKGSFSKKLFNIFIFRFQNLYLIIKKCHSSIQCNRIINVLLFSTGFPNPPTISQVAL